MTRLALAPAIPAPSTATSSCSCFLSSACSTALTLASGTGGCTAGPGSSFGGGRVCPAARGGSGSARSFRRLSLSRSALASILRQLRHRLASGGSGSSCGGCTSCSGSDTRCFVGRHRLPRLWPLLLRQLPPPRGVAGGSGSSLRAQHLPSCVRGPWRSRLFSFGT